MHCGLIVRLQILFFVVFIMFFNNLMDVMSALKISANFEVVDFHLSQVLSSLPSHVIHGVI